MKEIKTRLLEHLEDARANDYQPVYLAVQGSQNYDLQYEHSDVDTKAIVLPSLNDIVLSKKQISTTHILENDEHCDVKDIRLMFGNFKKQNINFLEILFTPYYWIEPMYKDEFEALRAMNEEIARYDMTAAVNCMAGMAYEKKKAMEHPYPATIEKIEKFGYDPKQLHHIIRMREFLERFLNGESFKDCLHTNHKDYLLKIKRGEFPLEQARIMADIDLKKIDALKDKYRERPLSKNLKTEEKLNEIMTSVISKKLKAELISSL